ncbi:MAG: HAD-IA family hydrolase [Bacteroidia bacterium]|nr:HAD-IA family hydrolase [Bacteroidia bacterium]
MTRNFSSVKNLLIDLGGVLYEINVPKTFHAYHNLLPDSLKEKSLEELSSHPAFKKLDRGELEIEEMAEELIKDWNLATTVEEIERIWLDLLVGLFPDRVRSISQLKQKFNLALLSNTSRVHYNYYIEECKPMFDIMDRCFFSFEMGMSKPGKEIYQKALETMGWKAGETLFLDDSRSNIQGARDAGLMAELIEKPSDFDDLLTELIEREWV